MKKDIYKKILLAVILPCALVLALPFFVNNADDFIRAFTKILAGEKSYVKTTLLLVYLISLGFVTLLVASRAREGSARKKWGIALAVSLGVSYALNLASILWFMIVHRFPLSEFVVTMSNGDISSTQLMHNHVLKGAVGIFSQFYKGGVYEGVDAGVAFVGLIPTWFFALAAVAFVAALVSAIGYFGHIISEYITGKKKGLLLFVFLYGLSSFVLLKNTLDGGLFDYAVLPAALFLMLASGVQRSVAIRNSFALGALTYMALACAFAHVTIAEGSIAPLVYFYRSVVAFIVLYAIYFALHSRANPRLKVLVALGAASVLWYPVQTNIGVIRYEKVAINQEEGAIVSTYGTPSGAEYSELGRIGDLKVYRYLPAAVEGTTVDSLVKENRLYSNFYPVSVPWNTCVPLDNSIDYTFRMTSFTPVSVAGNDLVTLLNFRLESVGAGLHTYAVTLRTNGCLPRPLDVIKEFFRSQGVQTFFISGVETSEYVYEFQ